MRTIRMLATCLGVTFVLASQIPAAAAQSPSPAIDPSAAVEFSGRINYGGQTVEGTEEDLPDGHAEVRGNVFAPFVVEMSDPRLYGTVTLTVDIDYHPLSGTDDQGVSLWTQTWRIENPAGAWEGSQHDLGFSDGSMATTTAVLRGEGAYAGLLAPMEVTLTGGGWDVRGFIVPGDAPPGE